MRHPDRDAGPATAPDDGRSSALVPGRTSEIPRGAIAAAAAGRARAVRRVAAAVALGCAAAATLIAPAPGVTQAGWTDAEHAMGATALQSLRLQPPQVSSVSCRRPNLGGDVLIVHWSWAAADPPLTASDALWRGDGVAFAPQPPTSGPSGGVYTTTFTSAVLGTALGSLDSSYTVDVGAQWVTAGGQTWRSPGLTRIDVTVPPRKGSPTCTATNGT